MNWGSKTVELMGKGLSWSAHDIEVLSASMANGRTLCVIHRRRTANSTSRFCSSCTNKGCEHDTQMIPTSTGNISGHRSKKTTSYLKGPEIGTISSKYLGPLPVPTSMSSIGVYGADQAPPRADRVLCSFTDRVAACGRRLEGPRQTLPLKPTS